MAERAGFLSDSSRTIRESNLGLEGENFIERLWAKASPFPRLGCLLGNKHGVNDMNDAVGSQDIGLDNFGIADLYTVRV